MQQNKPLLSIRDLSVEYHANDSVIRAVNGVSLDLEAGCTLGLVGETGSGKTTIAKSIMRILLQPPAVIRAGEIFFDGRDLLMLPEREMRRVRGGEISMVFQDPMTALNPIAYVGDQIAEAIRLHEKLGKLEARRKAATMLEMVGIPAERYEDYPHQFSGGMKQRVIIAIALACNPHLLLADEPTTALDVTIQAQVLDMMENLKRQLNTAMILITHDLGIVARNCDRVAIIYAGSIMEVGTKEDVFDGYAHPYTEGLFGCIPTVHMDKRRLTPIAGMIPDPANLPEGCPFAPRCRYASDDCRRGVIPTAEVAPGHRVRCLHPIHKGA